jgi:predicted TIM-barrel fold metal-dependent hydrolase
MPPMNAFKPSHLSTPAFAPSRREFVSAAAAATGIAALFPRLALTAQSGNNPQRIDVHHHFVPPAYVEFTKAHNQSPGLLMKGRTADPHAANPWELSIDLDDMDKNGTAVSLLSVTTPGFWFGSVDEIRKVMRECNESAAKISKDHAGRFGSFAAIHPPDADGSLKEIEYSLDTLKAEGIGLFSNYRDKWLGHESFAPVYQELNRRKAVVFVHPITGACCGNLVPGVADTLVDYGADTTRTIGSLIYSGTTTKYPDIRWIFSHGGGVMPYVIERFLGGTQAEIVPGIVTKGQDGAAPKNAPAGTLAEIRKLHFDTAQASNPVAMGALRKVVPVSQILFGTDYWYRTAAETGHGLVTSKVFNAAELRMINRGNAERLMPKFKA